MTDEKKAPSMSAEQAADFAALQSAASEAPPAPGEQQEQEQHQGPDLATEIAGLAAVAVATLSPLFPSLKETYTQEVTKAAAQAIAAVCDKHGWMQGGMMGKWGEEIACAAIVGPLAFQTYQGIKSDLAARAPKKPPERIEGPDMSAPVPETVAGSKTVSFGAVAA